MYNELIKITNGDGSVSFHHVRRINPHLEEFRIFARDSITRFHAHNLAYIEFIAIRNGYVKKVKPKMNHKDKMIELLVNKLRKRILELDRDAARLSLVNASEASERIRDAIKALRLAVVKLEG